jgi:8-oxo-dGTP pyrophosphatase MutT (NUDIX family)
MILDNKGVGVIVQKDDKILVGMRTDGKGWGMPGGHVDGRETIRQAAIRELEEESGLIPANLIYKGRAVSFNEGHIWISPVFFADDFAGTPQNTDEVINWTWIDPYLLLQSKKPLFEPAKQALLAHLTALWL